MTSIQGEALTAPQQFEAMRVADRLRRKPVEAVEQGGPHLPDHGFFIFLEGLTLPEADEGAQSLVSVPSVPVRPLYKSKGYGRLPAKLLESDMPWNAKYVYGIITSFGPDTRASINSIARRGGIGPKAVRDGHKMLEEKGWIELISEGSGNGKGTGKPRIWEVKDYPFEGISFEGGQKVTPSESDTLNKKGSCTSKQETPSTAPLPPKYTANLAVRAFCSTRPTIAAYLGKKYRVTGPDSGAVAGLFKRNEITEAEWMEAQRNYWFAEAKYTGDHNLKCLCDSFNRYLGKSEPRKNRGVEL